MRNAFSRLTRRVIAVLRPDVTYQADFDDDIEMALVARALRSEGYKAWLGKTPLRLVVTASKAGRGR